MEKSILFGLCVVLLLALPSAAFAVNETPAGNKTEGINATLCGNGKMDTGETCLTCKPDVCKSWEACTEDGKCKQTNFTMYIIIGIGIFVLLALFFVAKRIAKKPEELMQKPQLIQPVQKSPEQKPMQLSKQEPVKQVAPKQAEEPAATAGSAAILMSKPQEAPAKEEPAQEEETDEHAGETQIQMFIRQRSESGWTDEQIRQKMKESGWKDTQIALEFLKLPGRKK